MWIFGYVGKDPGGIRMVLDGLGRLEHRGYDSIGAVFNVGGEHQVYKISTEARGEISFRDIEKMIEEPEAECYLGLGHTRWASCGAVTDRNAHPHSDILKRCRVVHNGNIENCEELRTELKSLGIRFFSDTDTEIIAHLFARYFRGNAVETAEMILSKIVGANSFVVMVQNFPRLLVAANRGGTLILEKGEKGTVITSDPLAIPSWTDRKRVDLESNEIALISPEGWEIFSNGNHVSKREYEIGRDDEEDLGSDNEHGTFMLKEIFEQPYVVGNILNGRVIEEEGISKLGGLEEVRERLLSTNRFHFVGCGTANFACQWAMKLFEEFNLSAQAWIASEFNPDKSVIRPEDTFVFVSQSGETADTISVLEKIKRKGNLTLGLVNVPGSKIARLTDAGIHLRAGVERAVASTKAYTAMLVNVALMLIFICRNRGLEKETGKKIISEMKTFPEKIQAILDEAQTAEKLAAKYQRFRNFYFLGRYFNYVSAMEGAIKLKEISYVHAESYPLGEMKHGPLALIDPDFCSMVIIPDDQHFSKGLMNIREIKARMGRVIALTNPSKVEELSRIVDDVVAVPATYECLTPVLTNIFLQLFSCYMAIELRLNPDKPRNLAKTVTVE